MDDSTTDMTSLRIPTTIYVYAIAIIIGHGSWAQPVDLTAVGQQDMQIPVDVQMPQDQVIFNSQDQVGNFQLLSMAYLLDRGQWYVK